jgi:hypothetical protein
VSPPLRREPRPYTSLEEFPNLGSGRWTVVIGDRRQSPPEHLNDLLTIPVSAVDVMFLLRLRLAPETDVLSDRLVYLAPHALGDLLGKSNVLIIGSPAVSLACRKLLEVATPTFTFNIERAVYNAPGELERIIPENDRYNPDGLRRFHDSNRSKMNHMVKDLRKGGFVDPVKYRGIRGENFPKNVDYGIVALARNPWADDAAGHVACICAGVSGPGTAGAVQMLSKRDEFVRRPWGGVFKVTVPQSIPWERRFWYLHPQWDTHEYEPAGYQGDLQHLSAERGRETGASEEARKCLLDATNFEQAAALAEMLSRPRQTSSS